MARRGWRRLGAWRARHCGRGCYAAATTHHRRPRRPNQINGPVLGAAAPPCAPAPPFQASGPGALGAPFGLAFWKDYLYVGNSGSIVRYKYAAGDLTAQGEPEKLLDLPAGGHSTRTILFNRAGTKMYVAVGSQSNNNAGEDCRRAAILEFNPDGSGYRVFASGIRNPVGLALQPGTDTIWTAVNERDNLGDDLVPDYATSVRTAASTAGRTPTLAPTTIRATSARFRIW
jgi:glucose/arabinose dehydrogenase